MTLSMLSVSHAMQDHDGVRGEGDAQATRDDSFLLGSPVMWTEHPQGCRFGVGACVEVSQRVDARVVPGCCPVEEVCCLAWIDHVSQLSCSSAPVVVFVQAFLFAFPVIVFAPQAAATARPSGSTAAFSPTLPPENVPEKDGRPRTRERA